MSNGQKKITIIIRKDLDLSRGKWMAQVAHAIYRSSIWWDEQNSNPMITYDQHNLGKTPLPKAVVFYVKSENALLKLKAKLEADKESSFPWGMQVDEGHNEVEKGTPTCIVIGPCTEEQVTPYTKRLQVLKD